MSDLKCFPIGRRNRDWIDYSELCEGTAIVVRWMTEHRYADHTIMQYRNIIAHFARWMRRQHIATSQLNEDLARRFVDRHLPTCRCAGTFSSLRRSTVHNFEPSIVIDVLSH